MSETREVDLFSPRQAGKLPDYQAAYNACYIYDGKRNTIGSRLLFFAVQIMFNDWLSYRID
jgi:hypothetical protein